MGRIRIAEVGDAAALAEIYGWYVENSTATFDTEKPSVEDMKRRIEEIGAKYPFFVYEEDGDVAGYCFVHEWKPRSAYSHTVENAIYLRHGMQGNGIGQILMARLKEACRKRGFRVIIACITKENEESIRFHKKLGFRQVSDFKEVGYKFGRCLDVIDLELIL